MAHRLTRVGLLLALGTGIAACHEASRPDTRPTIRLSPRSTVATGGVTAARLVDRDTTVFVAIDQVTSATLSFGHEVTIRRLRVNGAKSVSISAGGASPAAADAAGWADLQLPQPLVASELTVTIEPTGAGAGLREIEAWGAGEAIAPVNPAVLAAATAGEEIPVFENAWVLKADTDAAVLKPAAPETAAHACGAGSRPSAQGRSSAPTSRSTPTSGARSP